MIKQCKKRLIKISKHGTHGEKKIADALLSYDSKISKIADIAKMFNVSNSSITRFVHSMGYSSFKHFQFEYNRDDNTDTWTSAETVSSIDYTVKYYEKAKVIANKVGMKDIYVIPSKRSFSLAIMMRDRLKDANIKCVIFDKQKMELSDFIKMSNNGVLFIISISGFSKIFSDSIHEISMLEQKHDVIIVTAAKWMEIFKKYEFISLGNINESINVKVEAWEDYNNSLLEVAVIMMGVVKEIYLKRKKEKAKRLKMLH